MPIVATVGLIGLGIMGQNLAINIASRGYPMVVYNRTASRTQQFLSDVGGEGDVVGAPNLDDFIGRIERPRRVILMVDAGPAVDHVLDQIVPLLDPGDVIVDGGNSLYSDTDRRIDYVEATGLHYLGTGISGGAMGARFGPSIMPGGSEKAYTLLEPIFTRIAAKVDDGPCVTHVGDRSAGHYVKMVHNGIEYGDMQLIAEAYSFLAAAGYEPSELAQIFSEWNKSELESYLIQITADIFKVRDEHSDGFLFEAILDKAGQKGTGRWTSQEAMALGTPIPTIDAAVWSRNMSSRKSERIHAAGLLRPSSAPTVPRFDGLIESVRHALYAAKICSYAQGMALLRVASETHSYQLNHAELARIWKSGCIIRARLLADIQRAFNANPSLVNLLLDDDFRDQLAAADAGWRKVVASAKNAALPFAAMNASLDYYDAYHSSRLPTNLTQAQRDYFGAHSYERIDRSGVFHSQWEQGALRGSATSDPVDN